MSGTMVASLPWPAGVLPVEYPYGYGPRLTALIGELSGPSAGQSQRGAGVLHVRVGGVDQPQCDSTPLLIGSRKPSNRITRRLPSRPARTGERH